MSKYVEVLSSEEEDEVQFVPYTKPPPPVIDIIESDHEGEGGGGAEESQSPKKKKRKKGKKSKADKNSDNPSITNAEGRDDASSTGSVINSTSSAENVGRTEQMLIHAVQVQSRDEMAVTFEGNNAELSMSLSTSRATTIVSETAGLENVARSSVSPYNSETLSSIRIASSIFEPGSEVLEDLPLLNPTDLGERGRENVEVTTASREKGKKGSSASKRKRSVTSGEEGAVGAGAVNVPVAAPRKRVTKTQKARQRTNEEISNFLMTLGIHNQPGDGEGPEGETVVQPPAKRKRASRKQIAEIPPDLPLLPPLPPDSSGFLDPHISVPVSSLQAPLRQISSDSDDVQVPAVVSQMPSPPKEVAPVETPPIRQNDPPATIIAQAASEATVTTETVPTQDISCDLERKKKSPSPKNVDKLQKKASSPKKVDERKKKSSSPKKSDKRQRKALSPKKLDGRQKKPENLEPQIPGTSGLGRDSLLYLGGGRFLGTSDPEPPALLSRAETANLSFSLASVLESTTPKEGVRVASPTKTKAAAEKARSLPNTPSGKKNRYLDKKSENQPAPADASLASPEPSTSNVTEEFKPPTYLPSHWTSEMVKYYDGKNEWQWPGQRRLRDVLATMSDNPSKWETWESQMPVSKVNKKMRCMNCQQQGHFARQCTEKRKPRVCHMCGFTGHTQNQQWGHGRSKCKFGICLTCGILNGSGNFHKSCRDCLLKRVPMKCSLCQAQGHMSSRCPDQWRKYFSTISLTRDPETGAESAFASEKPIYRKHKDSFCCNCGSRGHAVYHCRVPCKSQNFPKQNPRIIEELPVLKNVQNPLFAARRVEISTGKDNELADTAISVTIQGLGNNENECAPQMPETAAGNAPNPQSTPPDASISTRNKTVDTAQSEPSHSKSTPDAVTLVPAPVENVQRKVVGTTITVTDSSVEPEPEVITLEDDSDNNDEDDPEEEELKVVLLESELEHIFAESLKRGGLVSTLIAQFKVKVMVSKEDLTVKISSGSESNRKLAQKNIVYWLECLAANVNYKLILEQANDTSTTPSSSSWSKKNKKKRNNNSPRPHSRKFKKKMRMDNANSNNTPVTPVAVTQSRPKQQIDDASFDSNKVSEPAHVGNQGYQGQPQQQQQQWQPNPINQPRNPQRRTRWDNPLTYNQNQNQVGNQFNFPYSQIPPPRLEFTDFSMPPPNFGFNYPPPPSGQQFDNYSRGPNPQQFQPQGHNPFSYGRPNGPTNNRNQRPPWRPQREDFHDRSNSNPNPGPPNPNLTRMRYYNVDNDM